DWGVMGVRVEFPPHKKAIGVNAADFDRLWEAFALNVGPMTSEQSERFLAAMAQASASGVIVPKDILDEAGIVPCDNNDAYKKASGLLELNAAIDALGPSKDHPIHDLEEQKKPGFGRFDLNLSWGKETVFNHLYFMDLVVRDREGRVRSV